MSHPQNRDCLPGRSHSVFWEAQVHNPQVSCYASLFIFKCFLGGSMVKNPPANARDDPEMQSIPGLRRSPEEEMVTHSSILAWEIPWTEEPRGLQSMGLQRVGRGWATKQQQQQFIFKAYWLLIVHTSLHYGLLFFFWKKVVFLSWMSVLNLLKQMHKFNFSWKSKAHVRYIICLSWSKEQIFLCVVEID